MATIKICDICGTKKCVETKQYATGRTTDAAGSADDICEEYDLCHLHIIQSLEYALNYIADSRFDANSAILDYVKQRIE